MNRLDLFRQHINKDGPTIREELGPCWEWTGTRGRAGYGVFYINGSLQYAHRIAYAAEHGQVGRSRMICHKCDNRLCVRVDHLYDGKARSNLIDAYRRKRRQVNVPLGEDHPRHKLTHEQAAEIRDRTKNAPITQQQLAREYGVNQSTIQRLLAGRTWKGDIPP